jgi:ATP-dependent exoDNAse (exonuclease V) alpha subunit
VVDGRYDMMNRWKACRVLIIDELSMLSGPLFDKLDYIARQGRHITGPLPLT